MPKREIRDPVYGFVHRDDAECGIIDTSIFQRLRGIKQLAMANLVYPGAVHTRFDHSIGVMHVAGNMADSLLEDSEEKRLVRLAALLHDIGHGPFSHISEDSLAKFYDHGKVKVDAPDKIHEDITAKIILGNKEIGKFVSPRDREKIVDLLKGNNTSSVLTSIVSGPLDADKQDYLLRDSYFCGVKYGVFDAARLHNTLTVYDDEKDRCLAVAEDGVHALEQYILAKYYLTTNVYRHKVRLITDAMLTRAIHLGIEKDKIDFLEGLYSYDGSEKYLRNYVKWNDSRLTQEILKVRKGYAREIFIRLSERRLFKRVYTSKVVDEFPAESRSVLADLVDNPQSALQDKMAKSIADYLQVDPLLVVVFAFKVRFVGRDTETSPINILRGREPVHFEDESTLFRSIKSAMEDFYLEVYAPVTYTTVEKRQKIEEWRVNIKELIVKSVLQCNEEATR